MQDILAPPPKILVLRDTALLLTHNLLEMRRKRREHGASFGQLYALTTRSTELEDQEARLGVEERFALGGADPAVGKLVCPPEDDELLLLGIVPEFLDPVGGLGGFAVAAGALPFANGRPGGS